MFRSSCLVCKSRDLSRIIELGRHPFADSFIPESRLSESEPVYPLSCDLCNSCGQIQASCVTKPEERYSLYDYSYTSSNSAFSRNHWQNYADAVSEKLSLEKGSFVVEIGSNDGFLSEQFLKKGYKVLGVDPSQYMANLARQRGIKTIAGLFDSKTAEKICKEYGKAELIIANNVFNHSNNPVDFAKGVSELLRENGTFVFELPYWLSLVKSRRFDQIYHEHVSYFTVKSASEILGKAGMRISGVGVVDYHGDSLRVFAKKMGNRREKLNEESKAMINQEENFGVFNKKTYNNFMKHILSQRNIFLNKVNDIKAQGGAIVAVGAAAKGNTLLNFYNLDNKIIDYVTDSSPYKQGKYTPSTRIPIVGDEIFAEYDDVYALILAWNISDKLKEVLKNINPKIKFLTMPE